MLSDPSVWLQVLGRTHPVVLHLPLGLLPGLCLLEFGALALRRAPPRGAVLALAVLTGASSVAAAFTGLVLAAEHRGGELLEQHKQFGIALGVAGALLPLLLALPHRAPFRVLLALAALLALPAGHLGGSLTHGRNFLIEPLVRAGRADPAAAPAVGSESAFAREVLPMLERVCTSCHNPDKQKGELLLTDHAAVLRGGENGAVVLPGEPDRSPLLTRCLLPLDDDDHMPPDGKPQPTADELDRLRRWIAAGAPE